MNGTRQTLLGFLKDRSDWVRRETLKIHKIAPETRIASSLSCVEIFVTLFYGGILRFRLDESMDPHRDRLIVSKGHGSICLYPILSNMGYFPPEELAHVCENGALLGSIPDPTIPGYETINGSLGHGLGVACGVALALLHKDYYRQKVYVVCSDGELFEGSTWEAIMFAAHHRLRNITLIVDNNRTSMMGRCKDIIDISPLSAKFKAFGWECVTLNGHNTESLYTTLNSFKRTSHISPQVIIANTVKGKGVPSLENDELCHVKSVPPEEIDRILEVTNE